MMTNESETLLPPAVNAGADCPAGGQCDICPIADKCTQLNELRTYETEHEMLLPTTFHRGPGEIKPGQGGQDSGEALYPAGVE